MSKILELRNKRATAWDEAKKFLDAHTDADGNMSAEDAQQYERMETDITNMTTNIDRLERAEQMDREMANPINKPIRENPGAAKKGTASDAYAGHFWDYVRSRSVQQPILDALEEGVAAEGGYTVPDEFDHTLIEALQEQNVLRRLCHTIRTSGGERKIPVVATKGTASWVEEEGAISESDVSFGQKTLSAYKLGTMIKISEELLQDSAFDLASYVAREFARRFGDAEESAFLVGDGSGKPTGLLNASDGAETGVTAASATAITGDELMDLQHSLRTPYRKKAVWLMHDGTVKLVRKLKDGNNNYIWQPGLTAGAPDMILGRPVETSVYMPAATGSNKAIAFGDFGYYWIGDRKSRTLRRLNELYAVNGQVGFLATERLDGKLMLPEAIKCLVMAGG